MEHVSLWVYLEPLLLLLQTRTSQGSRYRWNGTAEASGWRERERGWRERERGREREG